MAYYPQDFGKHWHQCCTILSGASAISPPCFLVKVYRTESFFQLIPKVFDWVHIRTLCGPRKTYYIIFILPFFCYSCSMDRSIVLLKFYIFLIFKCVHVRNQVIL